MSDQIEVSQAGVGEEIDLELESRYHRPECPENEFRLEDSDGTITTGGPSNPDFGKPVKIIRCADCGGQKVVDKTTGKVIG